MEHRIDSSQFEASEIEAILDLVRRKKPALIGPEGHRTELPEPPKGVTLSLYSIPL